MLQLSARPAADFLLRISVSQRDQIRWVSLLLVYLWVAVSYVIMTPAGEGVDEIPHFDYVRFVREEQRLPVNRVGEPLEAWMAHHPPLYYVLSALVISPFDTQDREEALFLNPRFEWNESGEYGWNVVIVGKEIGQSSTLKALYLLRLFNVILGALALFFIYTTARLLFPDQAWAPLATAAIIGLNPSFVFMAATIHHDVLLAAVYAAGLFWCVRATLHPLTLKLLLMGAGLVAAALLTKLSGATLSMVVAGVILARNARSEDWMPLMGGWRSRFVHLAVVGGLSLLLAGWWPVRNWILYGDLLAWEMFMRVHAHMAREGYFVYRDILWELVLGFGRTFWGAFGYMHILLPVWMREITWMFTVVALAGLLIAVPRMWQQRNYQRWQVVAWSSLLVALALVVLSFIRFATYTVGAGHGRYLFPVAVSLANLLTVGINGCTNWRHQRSIVLLLLVVMTAYAIAAPHYYVWPKYALPPMLSAQEVSQAEPVEVRFDGGLTLQSVTVSDPIVIPGQGLSVVTYWMADETVERSYDPWIELALVSEDGVLLGRATFWPEMATLPAVWHGRIIANPQSFYIPQDDISGQIVLSIQVRNGKGGAVIPTSTGAQSVVVGELVALGAVMAFHEYQIPTPVRNEIFADALHLLSVSFPDKIEPARVFPVQFFWKVLQPVAADYTIFIHIVDSNDQIIAQLDRPPGGGTSPTSSWQVDQLLRDTYPVPLPSDLPPGLYRVRMGLYTWPDLTLQPVHNGESVLGDHLWLGSFQLTTGGAD
jgi:4-amino-4-deoxy-L-arabinose transferase-like glycosyltransferase